MVTSQVKRRRLSPQYLELVLWDPWGGPRRSKFEPPCRLSVDPVIWACCVVLGYGLGRSVLDCLGADVGRVRGPPSDVPCRSLAPRRGLPLDASVHIDGTIAPDWNGCYAYCARPSPWSGSRSLP